MVILCTKYEIDISLTILREIRSRSIDFIKKSQDYDFKLPYLKTTNTFYPSSILNNNSTRKKNNNNNKNKIKLKSIEPYIKRAKMHFRKN